MKLKTILIVLSCFFATSAFGTISLSGSTSVLAGAGSGALNTMVVEGSGGTESSSAIEVYVPMKLDSVNCATTDTSECFYIHGKNDLPFYTSDTNGGMVKIKITVDNNTYDDYYLYAGIVDYGDSNKMTTISGGSYSGSSLPAIIATSSEQSNTEFSPYLYLNNICRIHSINGGNCNYFKTATGSETEEEVTLYFFVSQTSYTQFVELNISDFSGGIYYKLKLSNQINTLSSYDVSLTELRKGDERVTAVYSGSIISQFYDVIGFKYLSSVLSRQNIQQGLDASGEIASDKNGAREDGEIVIKGLYNDQAVHLSVAFVNKWQFATKLSPSLSQTPENIETFLQSQACYLLSAGFQREHYVIEYFKDFRDGVLLKSELGKMVVKFYYQSAPHFTHYIYRSKSLSFLMRSFGYFLYFIFNFYSFITLVIVLAICSVLVFKKRLHSAMS